MGAYTISFKINGVESKARVLRAGPTVADLVNDTPNTAQFTIVKAPAPVAGQTVRVTMGTASPRLLHNGVIDDVVETYIAQPKTGTVVRAWRVTSTDDQGRGNRRRPFGTWTNVSATTIAIALVTGFTSGFTTTHVQTGLPAVSITFDGTESMSAALSRLAQAIGGYWFWEDSDLWFFTTASPFDLPDPIDATHRPLEDPKISITTDVTQLRTRIYGRGHGEAIPCDVAAAETIIPIADAVMFTPAGGRAIAGRTADGAQSDKLTYTGIQLGSAGALAGPGAAPSVAPTGTPASGAAGLTAGLYGYAYTFVTGAGESLPSPSASMNLTGLLAAPSSAPTFGGTGVGGLAEGFYGWAYIFVNSAGETTEGPRLIAHTIAGQSVTVTAIAVGPTGTTQRKLYRTAVQASSGNAGTAQLKLVTTVADNTTTSYADSVADGSLGANVPTSNTATALRADVAGVAVGPSGTTSRKLYRTASGGSQLKLVATIADNTTTTYADSVADGSLGANVPTGDTSGLSLVAGQINAGSTTLLLSGAGPFASGGGWAQAGNSVVRYTGISGNTLTGIPASGIGSLGNSLRYGEHIGAVPALTGVTGAQAMLKGSTVSIWVQRDDVVAQAAAALRDGAGDGIYEDTIIDGRREEASLSALCDARLARYGYPLQTVRYATRDVKTKSGKPVTFNVASPAIVGTLLLQEVQITEIDLNGSLPPKYTCVASSVRFSLDDLLRQLLTRAAV